MRKIKKYFKWLTFLSAPLLATTSLLALTSCSSEESNSSSSDSGSNSNNNQATNNSNKEIPEGKVLLSDLVNDKPIGRHEDFISLNNYNDAAWEYKDGTPIEYKATIKVEDDYHLSSNISLTNYRKINFKSTKINGFEYTFNISKNKSNGNFEYKNLNNTNLIPGRNSVNAIVYLLPLEEQCIVLNEFPEKRINSSAICLKFCSDGQIYLVSDYFSMDFIKKNFGGAPYVLFSKENNGEERYYRFTDENIGLLADTQPSLYEFIDLKGSINIEI